LAQQEFRIIHYSSERALGEIARAAGGRRLGGEEVRVIDVPATEPGASGIFDEKIVTLPGKTMNETTQVMAGCYQSREHEISRTCNPRAAF